MRWDWPSSQWVRGASTVYSSVLCYSAYEHLFLGSSRCSRGFTDLKEFLCRIFCLYYMALVNHLFSGGKVLLHYPFLIILWLFLDIQSSTWILRLYIQLSKISTEILIRILWIVHVPIEEHGVFVLLCFPFHTACTGLGWLREEPAWSSLNPRALGAVMSHTG